MIMKKTPKGLKVIVVVAFSALITTYVLYSAGLIQLDFLKGGSSMGLNATSRDLQNAPPFELPHRVLTQAFGDTSTVVAYKLVAGDKHVVEVLTEIAPAKPNRNFAPSSKDMVPAVAVEEQEAILDSILVPDNWKKETQNSVYVPKWVKEQGWMMSSKAAIVVDEPDEREILTNKIFADNAGAPWIMLDEQADLVPANQGVNINNSNHK